MSHSNDNQSVSYAGCFVETEKQKKKEGVAVKEKANGKIQVINDTQMICSDGWEFSRIMPRGKNLLNNTCSVSSKAGATAEYTFQKCSRIWVYKTDECTDAVASIVLDGIPMGTVDCSKLTDQVLFDSGNLAAKAHRIQIIVVEGTLKIDRLEGAGAYPKRLIIDSRNRDFAHYTSGFSVKDNVMTSSEADAECEIYFMGASIEVSAKVGESGGIAQFSLNGNAVEEIDFYSPSEKVQTVFKAVDLPLENFNRLKIVVTGKGNKKSNGCEITLCSFAVESHKTVITEMNRQTEECLKQMDAHQRGYDDPKTWKKVELTGHNPSGDVTLFDGLFKSSFDRNICYLLDSIKLPSWVDIKDSDRIWTDMLVASNEGRMLGGMANTLLFAEVEEFRTFIKDLLAEIDRRQFTNMNGYCLPYESALFAPSSEGWPGFMRDEIRNYDRTMFTKGLLAAGYAGYNEAFDIVRKFYDWFNRAYEYLPNLVTGAMGIQGSAAGPRVYHSPCGVPEDIITNMKYYDMEWWISYLGQGIPEAVWRYTLNRPHNYLLTSICALFDIYKATGIERYIAAAKGAWGIYREYFRNTGGGISICEHFECLPKSHNISSRPISIYETCAAVFWIELNNRLLQMEPDNQVYAQEIEESLYNFMFSCQGEDGRIRYFSHMNGKKEIPGRYNTCCEIQATAFFGIMPQYIYMLRDDGISVNLFENSQIKFDCGGNKFALKTTTNFPFGDDVKMEVGTEEGGEFTLYIRIPTWCDSDVSIFVNGTEHCVSAPNGYAAVKRHWSSGDTVSFTFNRSLKQKKYIGMHRESGYDRYSFMYGPLLMTLIGELSEATQPDGEQTILLNYSIDEFMDGLQHKDNLLFQTKDGKYQLVPYLSFQEGTFSCFPAFKK